MNVITAYDQEHAIGYRGNLPWHLPADLQRFKELTTGKAVLMGRKTFESIGKPLPNRHNVVISSSLEEPEDDSFFVARGFNEAVEIAESLGEIWVIGGAGVYHLALPEATKLYVTEVNARFVADTYFPRIDHNDWELVSEESRAADTQNPYDLTFKTYERTHK